ncbi:hypothetical protein BDF14DRAFT_1394029 [Spinellus fusiger]|nr:hypothetical protein BDF14DRAFT_1394029 [Spinellus fusiger]
MDSNPSLRLRSATSEHAPAQKVGGMRVKGPDPRRTVLKDEKADSEEIPEEEDQIAQRQIELEHQKANKLQQASEHAAQEAKHNANVSKNPGSNLYQGSKGDFQPRSMNH